MRATGRTVALAGAVVAVGAATLMGMTAGFASAATPGTCTQNVNVRAEPRMDAPIVAVCQAGTDVETGRTQNGFVQLTDLRGWAAEDYVQVGDRSSGTSPTGSRSATATPTPSGSESARGERSPESTGRATGPSSTPTTSSSDYDDAQDRDQDDEESLDEESPARGGLLGG